MKRAIGGGKSSTVVVVPLEDTLQQHQQQQHQQQPPPSSQQRQSLSSSSSFISPITTTTTSMANTNHTTMMNPPSSTISATTYNNTFNLRRFVYQQYHHHLKSLNGKKIISSTVFTLMLLLIIDSLWSSPNERIVPPNFANDFLLWVQDHPGSGLIWILLLMSISVICMIPIGTPLTLGCGYIYKGAYGWQFGIFIATCVSMMGSALGAIICFLLGRYLMRDMVKKWIRKYPIFDAIDIAAAEHGLRIMAMLYLTPILPLGPVSYMCGTTSLKLSHFILAKIAALPLMMLYVLIGASTGTLISTSNASNNNSNNSMDTTAADPAQSIEHNQTLIISGIVLSFASIAGITHYIKKELNQILERQKRELEHNGTGNNSSSSSGTGNNGIEFSHMSPVTTSTTPSKDIESGTATTSSTSSTSAYENNFIHILENDLVTTTPSSTLASTSIATTSIPSSSSTTTIPTLLVDDSNVHLSSTTTNTAPRQRKH